jgi:hypothetical protein
MAKTRYKQALIDSDYGTWIVSVPASVELDEQGLIENPQDVFEEGSQLVAVEVGVPPAGEVTDISTPELHACIEEQGPRYGAFRVRYVDDGEISLEAIPSLEQSFE